MTQQKMYWNQPLNILLAEFPPETNHLTNFMKTIMVVDSRSTRRTLDEDKIISEVILNVRNKEFEVDF